jgi:hypothetical protein
MAAKAKKRAAKQQEVAHEIGDGFVVAWDTDAVAVDIRDDLRETADDQIKLLQSNLISIKGDVVAPSRRRRRVRPQAA